MLAGIGLFFGFILGGMASMLTNLDSQRARYIHHLDVIKDHMVCYWKILIRVLESQFLATSVASP